MTVTTVLKPSDVEAFARNVSIDIRHTAMFHSLGGRTLRAFGVPRGGIPAAMAVGQFINLTVVDNARSADVIIDDIIDSGTTMNRYKELYPDIPFFALVNKLTPRTSQHGLGWVVFPWEGTEEASIEDNVRRLLQFVGEDPKREGLQETPTRVVKALQFWCSGYKQNPADVLKVFEDGAQGYDEMVSVCQIPIHSLCEHHMAAIFGHATIAYIPNGRIVGLSKLSRLANVFARRLQVQERLTNQIANALNEHLKPKGVGVYIKAQHMCMESRGVCHPGHTVTTALRGVVKEDARARAEFMRLV
jgi:GTP cyclohydrolase IA